jgi:hypothetical protein
LAATASSKLREEYRQPEFSVASIFLNEDVEDESVPHMEFLADFLLVVCDQLKRTQVALPDRSQLEGSDLPARMQSLRDFVRGELSQFRRSFLIVDGLDRCGAGLRAMLRNELSQLQDHKLNVMITSRLPVFFEGTAQDPDFGVCDHRENHILDPGQEFLVYMECHICSFILCIPCFDQLDKCPEW